MSELTNQTEDTDLANTASGRDSGPDTGPGPGPAEPGDQIPENTPCDSDIESVESEEKTVIDSNTATIKASVSDTKDISGETVANLSIDSSLDMAEDNTSNEDTTTEPTQDDLFGATNDDVQESHLHSGSHDRPEPDSKRTTRADDCHPISDDNGASTSAWASSQECLYHVKWVQFNDRAVPLITQNENGPCPLLAIINVLVLQEKIKLSSMLEIVSASQLMEYLGDFIFENIPKDINEDSRLNYEQNMHDAMLVLPKLQTGLDVNVKFTGVTSFEYTRECVVFDILGIQLYHGWLVDPENPQVQSSIGSCSYNQLVEKIINQKSSDKPELVQEALVAENFLERTASQLTYHGLCELNTSIKLGELAVFFRNNHFSTIYKHNDELFVLVTDQGFLTEGQIVWETLSNVEGDCYFVDSNFATYTQKSGSVTPQSQAQAIPSGSGTDAQLDQDYLVALSLQQEQEQQTSSWQTAAELQNLPLAPMTDHELALQLQETEERLAAADDRDMGGAVGRRPRMHPQQTNSNEPSMSKIKKKNSDCILL